jgi:flavin reductase (DIM6/NTAB) family NADH-FMN oxidoreductase RutF
MSEHAEKVMVGKMPALAVPVAIVGATVNGKANFNTLGCFGLVSVIKPMVFIMSGKSHYTNAGIRESGYFSVNIPSKGQMRETDYVGIVSGSKTDKSGVFATFEGSVPGVPMIRECPVNLLCKVIRSAELPNEPTAIVSEFFIGEVLEAYVDGNCLTDGKPDIGKINPLLLASAGSQIQYMCLGEPVGMAYNEGKALIKKTKDAEA